MGAQLAAQAQTWDALAVYHKQRIAHHRREARTCREEQHKIEAQCRELGIEIVYQRGGETHGGQSTRPDHADRTADHLD